MRTVALASKHQLPVSSPVHVPRVHRSQARTVDESSIQCCLTGLIQLKREAWDDNTDDVRVWLVYDRFV